MKAKGPALIFSTVFPEPSSSAAGVRQMQWIRMLLEFTDRVVLASPSALKSERDWGYHSMPDGVELISIPLNDWSRVEWIRELAPAIVLFDRFITEEQFGPLVRDAVPGALRLLETQDLHFLRRSRGEGLKGMSDLRSETAIRETASILRSDHSFVVSSFEARLLDREFGIGPETVDWIPFAYPDTRGEGADGDFESRSGFQFIGNFRHVPNLDGLRWFRNEVWPGVRKRLPGVELKIHGAYPSAEVMQWHRPKEDGIRVIGSVKRLSDAFCGVRVNLAPLRFGAGVKGKLLDGFHHGLPAVSTPVGAEGLLSTESTDPFPGMVVESVHDWVEACVRLHEDRVFWSESRMKAQSLMGSLYVAGKVNEQFHKRLAEILARHDRGETPRWISRILRDEFQTGRKYFSKWIEAKNASSVQDR
jgi:glycosyltransferase involved in cell wall biosynthesis